MTDVHTREEEDAFEYVCRHTLLRPRDLMTIGERLAALRPDERRNEYRLKEAVNQAATEIAHEYLAEIAPYVSGLKPERLFDRLPGHVLSRAEVELIGGEDESRDGQDGFSSLYRVGLLGYVQHDRVRGEWRQRFLRPGEATLETNGVLPRATHYLIHPVLSDVIARNNTGLPAAHRPRQHRRLRPALARVGAGRADARRAPVVRAQGRRAGLRGADARRRSTPRSAPRSRRPCGAGPRRRRSPRSVPATPC